MPAFSVTDSAFNAFGSSRKLDESAEDRIARIRSFFFSLLIQGFREEADGSEESPDDVHLEEDKLEPNSEVVEKVLEAMKSKLLKLLNSTYLLVIAVTLFFL